MSERRLTVFRLGRVEYEDGLALQRLFVESRTRRLSPDALLMLEHPPVLTLGRGATRENILAHPAELARVGAEVHETDRGGDVTYHGPGQLVGYPILHLPPDRQDVRRYVRDVEESIIRALARFGLQGARAPKWPGVWVSTARGMEKIAAIGVHLSRWYTRHGFALNVNTDLSHFGLIVPCGIHEAGVTSMERVLGKRVEVEEVERAVAESFAEVFGATLGEAPAPMVTVSVAVLRPRAGGPEVLLLQRAPERGGFWQLVTGRVEPGEPVERAAARELEEETGRALAVFELGYRHSFALGESVPPRLVHETAFFARWDSEEEPRLDPAEHSAHRWAPIEEAAALLPFKGLRRAVELARERLAAG